LSILAGHAGLPNMACFLWRWDGGIDERFVLDCNCLAGSWPQFHKSVCEPALEGVGADS